MSTWFWPLLDATPHMAGVIERTPSLGLSDDSAVDSSSGRTTPEMYPQYALPAAAEQSPSDVPTLPSLPDIIDARTAASVPIRNVCCIGAGYVGKQSTYATQRNKYSPKSLAGGPTAAMIALHNPNVRVTVVDRDEKRIRAWKSRHLPIHEPGLNDIVRLARDGTKACTAADAAEIPGNVVLPARQPNLFFSTAGPATIADADMILISVNTPTKLRGLGAGRATDMTALEGAVREIAQHAKAGAILVEKSTVPCKTGQLIKDIVCIVFKAYGESLLTLQQVEAHRPGVNFPVLSNPEFLSEGTAIRDLMQPDRVIIGCESTISGHRAAAALANLYASWVPRSKIAPINIWSSELCKLVANAMLAQRISSINSISAICEKTGANVSEIAKSVGLDARIGSQFLKAGLGFGGSCFRKDIASLTYLAESLGLHEVSDYWQQVLTMNDYQRSRFARNVISKLNNSLRGKKIAILGYAFKKDTGDARESPALDVLRILLEESPASVAIYDPLCSAEDIQRELRAISGGDDLLKPNGPVQIIADPYQACENSNAILVLTDWDMFKNTKVHSAPVKTVPQVDGLASSPADLLHLHDKLEKFKPKATSPPTPPMTPKMRSLTSRLDSYLISEPACPAECAQCSSQASGNGSIDTLAGLKPLNWSRIFSIVKEPRWVFDGRAVLDAQFMESLHFRIEVLGRASKY